MVGNTTLPNDRNVVGHGTTQPTSKPKENLAKQILGKVLVCDDGRGYGATGFTRDNRIN